MRSINSHRVLEIATQTREEFESWTIDEDVLRWLYPIYHPGHPINIGDYLKRARESFPQGCCGLASVYLMRELRAGEPKHGAYGESGHTVLEWAHRRIADITADQFGGPKVYVGAADYPWVLGRSTPGSAEVSLQATAHLLE